MPPRRMPRSPQSRPRTQTPRSPSSRPHRRTAPIRPLYRAVHKVVFVVVLSMVVVVVSCKREREKGRATGFTGLGQRKLAGRGRSRTTRPGLGPSMGRGRVVPREAGLGLGTHLRKMALRIHRLLRKPSSSCGSRYSVLVSLTLSLLQRAHRTPSRCRFWFGQTLLAQGGEASSASFPDGKLGFGGDSAFEFRDSQRSWERGVRWHQRERNTEEQSPSGRETGHDGWGDEKEQRLQQDRHGDERRGGSAQGCFRALPAPEGKLTSLRDCFGSGTPLTRPPPRQDAD